MADSFDSFTFSEWESALDGPSDSLSDDGREFHELKLSSKLTKTEEEINAFSVNESLGDIDRALFLLRKGQPIQKMSVVNGFHRLYEEYPEKSLEVVLPEIAKAASRCDKNQEFQTFVCNFLEDALTSYPCSKKEVQAIFEASKVMLKSDSEAVFQGSSKVYLSCIEFGLDRQVLLQLIKSAISECGFTQPTPTRVWSGKVLCTSATHLSSEEIESMFLEKVLVLCQDTDQDVRCCMGRQIGRLVRRLSAHLVLEKLMPEFIELAKDEERAVRIAAIEGLASILEVLSPPILTQFVLPTLFSVLMDPALKKGLSKEIGRYFWFCRDLISDQQKEKLLVFYESLSTDANQELPLNCGYNFPAIVKCVGMTSHVHRALQHLNLHTAIPVRLKLATCFSVLCELLQPNAYHHLQEIFFRLFDDEPSIFLAVTSHLEKVMESFLMDATFRKGTNMDDFILIVFRKLRSFVDAKKWNQVEVLLGQLTNVADGFSLEHLYETCVPILRRIVHEALTLPLKHFALKLLIVYARKFRKIEHRESVCRALVSDLAFSTDFQARLLFLRICQDVLQTCSYKFFRQYFAHAFLALSSDAVPSVRRRMAQLMPLANKAITVSGVDDAIVKKLGQGREELHFSGIDLDLEPASMAELAADQLLEGQELATIKDDLECRQRLLEKDKKKSAIKPVGAGAGAAGGSGAKSKKNSLLPSPGVSMSFGTGTGGLDTLRKKGASSTSVMLGSSESFTEKGGGGSGGAADSHQITASKSRSQCGLAPPLGASLSHTSLPRHSMPSTTMHRATHSEAMESPTKKEKPPMIKLAARQELAKRLNNRL